MATKGWKTRRDELVKAVDDAKQNAGLKDAERELREFDRDVSKGLALVEQQSGRQPAIKKASPPVSTPPKSTTVPRTKSRTEENIWFIFIVTMTTVFIIALVVGAERFIRESREEETAMSPTPITQTTVPTTPVGDKSEWPTCYGCVEVNIEATHLE